ncbi:lipase family protein [Amycolatopsis keratiniphila]|uniref:lipase family protein n=1 Tax=Amycolatopsis keratiniphila TaxID=129921 RepID=UPI002265D782|nr:lipase family protein [Amycolatopsis keratiniphila]
MVAGDVRTLARQYCATGNKAIKYEQYDFLSHTGTPVPWAPTALAWLNDRFTGKTAPSDCGRIPAGNWPSTVVCPASVPFSRCVRSRRDDCGQGECSPFAEGFQVTRATPVAARTNPTMDPRVSCWPRSGTPAMAVAGGTRNR